MNKREALHILGLDDEATPEQIKVAYKETVQILHPDKFASNPRLQSRATEQFKVLQEAYEYLQKHPVGDSTRGTREANSSRTHGASGSGVSSSARESEILGKLAGIQAARTQLVAQRDSLLDSRKMAIGFMVGGAVIGLLTRRIIALAGLGSVAFIWGLGNFISCLGNLRALNDRLSELSRQKKQLMAELEDL